MSTHHDVPIRTSAPPQPMRVFEDEHPSSNTSMSADGARSRPGEVWAGAISRVQTQVSLNTGLLDSERQKIQHLEQALEHLERGFNEVRAMVLNLSNDMRLKLGPATTRQDPADLQVISEQVGVLSTRVNEVDALRMRVTLLENRVKRQEDHGSPAVTDTRPGTGAAPRDPSFREVSIPSQPSIPPPASALPHPHHTLPPMRTSATMSPNESRPLQHTSMDPRQQSAEPIVPMQAPSTGSFRLGEPLPPPSALAGWRTGGEAAGSGSGPPALSAGSNRAHGLPAGAHNAGWAAVNAVPTTKRPFEEPRQSPYEASLPASPKRPKLAPIMPRNNYEETPLIPSSVPKSGTVDSYRTHSRAPSDGSQSQSQSLPTPASANIPGRRFIISTQSADSQESWRPEHERVAHHGHHGHGHGHGHGHSHGPHGHGRRGGRGGRGRGRGGHGPRGGRGGVLLGEGHELGTPEWERGDWTGSQISSNGFYHPLNHPPRSPEDSSRGSATQRGGAAASAPSEREPREAEFPATPLAVQGPHDPFTVGYTEGAAGQPTSGGKKSRTKPFRNSEGILIRKDGRPDMRSVSSANNLRKVHAKKEAERAEIDGRTPSSARSLAPAGSMSEDEAESQSGSPEGHTPGGDDRAEQQDTQERHRELMSRIFPSGAEETSRAVGERFSPSPEDREASNSVMKSEEESKDSIEPLKSQSDDVVMQENAGEHPDDTNGKVGSVEAAATVDEVNDEEKARDDAA